MQGGWDQGSCSGADGPYMLCGRGKHHPLPKSSRRGVFCATNGEGREGGLGRTRDPSAGALPTLRPPADNWPCQAMP